MFSSWIFGCIALLGAIGALVAAALTSSHAPVTRALLAILSALCILAFQLWWGVRQRRSSK